MTPFATDRLVLIPSYDTGPQLLRTVAAARRHWAPVWVVIDGNTDGSDRALEAAYGNDPALRLLRLPRNRGKGGAVLAGLEAAAAAGYSHVLTMDADGQHPAERIPAFMAASREAPDAMILGRPVFGPEAPAVRVQGRRISNRLAELETGRPDLGDVLCGFRVYPVAPLLAVMRGTRWMRRFDFDPEAAVRLAWRGVRPVNLPVAVRYLRRDEGGVSHFSYGRDNLLLAWMHARLLLAALLGRRAG